MPLSKSSHQLSEETAVRAYAAMMNTGSVMHIESLLADDFCYASQWVFHEITSKAEYLDYITPKLVAVRRAGAAVWAELGYLDQAQQKPCVILAQGEPDDLQAVVLVKVGAVKIRRIDMCMVPSPFGVHRTGKYPMGLLG